MTTLTPERIAQIRAQNAARATTDWPTRYLVDELLDALEAQAQEIAVAGERRGDDAAAGRL